MHGSAIPRLKGALIMFRCNGIQIDNDSHKYYQSCYFSTEFCIYLTRLSDSRIKAYSIILLVITSDKIILVINLPEATL